MTTVHISLVRDDGTDQTPARGVVEWQPTARREDGADVILPRGFTVPLVAGEATVTVDPSGLTWCWRVTERTDSGGVVRYVSVPDSAVTVEYVDLPDVDPDTLLPWTPADPEAAYQTALDNLGGVTSVDGKTGAVSLSDTYVAQFVQDDTPTAPGEGTSATYFVTSAVSWPAGLEWSTDPDGGVAPTITGTALVSLFTSGGTTRAILGATFPAVVVPDTTAPTAGILTASAIGTTSFTLTITGATDESTLHATPFAFSTDDGATWSDWQASHIFAASGLTEDTAYTCIHRVRDAAGNVSVGTSIVATTNTASAALPAAIAALTPVGYWKLDETTGTQATDYSGNNRHGTYTGTYTLAGQDGFVKFAGTGDGSAAVVPDADEFSITTSGQGYTIFALVKPTNMWGNQGIVGKYDGDNTYEYALRTRDGGVGLALHAPSYGVDTGVVSLTPSAWHGVAASVSHAASGGTATVKLYTDTGTPDTSNATVGTYPNGPDALRLGARRWSDDCHNALGHVAIFPRQLTDAEVGGLMSAAQSDGLIP